jgi:hypothetical protein
MPVHHAIWKVGDTPSRLDKSFLDNEQMLEEMIVADPGIVSEDWMLIGRQVETESGGFIDLLAIARDSSLVLIELKRDRTPRDVVAQALDYASWVATLRREDIEEIYGDFKPNQSLQIDFRERFGHGLDEDTITQDPRVIVVASQLDDTTERIIGYLSERGIQIKHGSDLFLSRAWLIDPHSQATTTVSEAEKQQWNGEFYVSFGEGDTRSWEDARQLGFISGGGGVWYSRTLLLLAPGDRIWVNVPRVGYVGVGRVTGRARPASAFRVKTEQGELPVLEVATRGHYLKDDEDDEERSEWSVPVRWLQTVPISAALRETGMFGNRNTVCKPTTPSWRLTIERLKQKFPKFDS